MRIILALVAITFAFAPYSAAQPAQPAESTQSARAPIRTPILVVGASIENGKTPCVVGKVNVLGCASVAFGDYLSVGQALTRSPLNNGSVIVEAISGATTFDRPGFINPTEQRAEVGWEEYGYDKQLRRAIAAATNRLTGAVTARHVVIGLANDCLHSNAFVTAPSQSAPCSAADRDAVVDRYLAVGRQAVAAGLTPVFTGYPPMATPSGSNNGLDLELAQPRVGFRFIISRADYADLLARFDNRIAAELPQAILAHAFETYEHLGDGLHPSRSSAERAAMRIMRHIVVR